jgi:bifunctional non-homologous end joining protein LigD
MPLHWEEVKKGLKIKDHSLKTAVARLKEVGDLFKGAIGKGINMSKVIHKMNSIFRLS